MDLNNSGVYVDEHSHNFLKKSELFGGEILIANVGAHAGFVCKMPHIGAKATLGPNMYLMRFNCDKVIQSFIYYVLVSIRSQEQLKLRATSTAQPKLNKDDVKGLFIAIPPLIEQNRVVIYLDHKTHLIDTLIEKKQKQIELLQEQRAAMINQAVTKGLNPNVRMKDSGIEWLGQVPKHWDILSLKYASNLQTGLTLGKDYRGKDTELRPYLRVANVQDGYLDLNEVKKVEIPVNEASRYELEAGDVLMTEGGDFDKLGRGFVWQGQVSGCLHQNHIFAVRPHKDLLNSWHLASVLVSQHGKHYFTSNSQQTTNLATTNSTKLKAFPIPLPPYDEQLEINRHIQNESKNHSDLINQYQKKIELLKEYRTTLISEIVTGKIDVRDEAIPA